MGMTGAWKGEGELAKRALPCRGLSLPQLREEGAKARLALTRVPLFSQGAADTACPAFRQDSAEVCPAH